MRALVQRVSRAEVRVEDRAIGCIDGGLVVLVGVTHGDDEAAARELARKVNGLRILAGERSVGDVAGAAVLAISQFTLYGDTRRGRRPSWSAAAPGAVAQPLFDSFVQALRGAGTQVRTGAFGAEMAVELVNDGPMTLLIEV